MDENGISPLPDRVVAIEATKPPTSIKELQRFLGMVGYYRRFIPNAARHLFHLFEALKGPKASKPKTLNWTPECQASFEATKSALAAASILARVPNSPSLWTLLTSPSAVYWSNEDRMDGNRWHFTAPSWNQTSSNGRPMIESCSQHSKGHAIFALGLKVDPLPCEERWTGLSAINGRDTGGSSPSIHLHQ